MATTAEAMVVDASVAAKWHLTDEDYAHDALALLSRFIDGKIVLFAPEHIRYEIASTLIAATLGNSPRLRRSIAEQAIKKFLALPIRTVNTDALILMAFPLVHQHTIAFYDALYLALAQELGLSFITADSRLYQRIKSLSTVVWIGDYLPVQPDAREEA